MNRTGVLLGWLFFAAADAAPEPAGLPNGMIRTPIPIEPAAENPVALSVDVDGTIYLGESKRAAGSAPDIREFPRMVPRSLEVRSILDLQKLYESDFFKTVPAKATLKDLNKDGLIDSKDLGVVSEQILRVIDLDGDGTVDHSTVFAESFKSEVTGTIGGILAWRGDVIAGITPDLWRLRDLSGDGRADHTETIASGFGVRPGIPDHDLRGATRGPDGRLYWAVGDKGTSTMGREGPQVVVPDEGCVLRSNPDGSRLEVFARGFRDIRQLAFDSYGNLFGIDNAPEGSPSRLLYIPEQGDFGWRCYYEFRGFDYNPWKEEIRSTAASEEQPAFLPGKIAGYSGKPVAGLIRDPEASLDPAVSHGFHFIELGSGALSRLQLTPTGTSFRVKEIATLPTAINARAGAFGPDGALYLIGSSEEPGATPAAASLWKLDHPAGADSPIRKKVAAMLKQGTAEISSAELIPRLAHLDGRIRCDAQWELATRQDALPLLLAATEQWIDTPQPLTHVLWALTQKAVFNEEVFTRLLTSKSEEVRCQTAKWAGEIPSPRSGQALIPLLRDPSLRVRYHAAIALGKLQEPGALQPLIEMLAENNDRDSMLRHAGIVALRGMPLALVEGVSATHISPAVRIAAVASFRHHQPDSAIQACGDPNPVVAAEAMRIVYEAVISDFGTNKSQSLMNRMLAITARTKTWTVSGGQRLAAVHRLAATSVGADQLMAIATNGGLSIEVRCAALDSLSIWMQRLIFDPVEGQSMNLPPAGDFNQGNFDKAKLADGLTRLTARSTPEAVVQRARRTAKALRLELKRLPVELSKDALNAELASLARITALEELARGYPKIFQALADDLLADDATEVRFAAARSAASLMPMRIQDLACETLIQSRDLWEIQQACDLLGRVDTPDIDQRFAFFLKRIGTDQWPNGATLDLIEAVRFSSKRNPTVRSVLEAFEKPYAAKGKMAIYQPYLTGGDAARGRGIFESPSAACITCHNPNEEAAGRVPPLAAAAARGKSALLESLVFPADEVDPAYSIVTVTLKTGESISGNPRAETRQALTLKQKDGNGVVISKNTIATRTPGTSPMPAATENITALELRDLVEYLSTRQ